MLPDPSPPFDVDFNGRALEQVRGILQRAVIADTDDDLRRSLGAIVQALRKDPRGFGEILHDLRVLQLENFLATENGIRVVFAVHKRIPIVFVNDVRLLPSHPLYDPAKDD